MHQKRTGLLILRFGLAAVFLWFGYSQLSDAANWTSWVPAWASSLTHLPGTTIVLANGLFEVVFGSLLVLGLWLRGAAILLALHLALITFEIGLNEIGVRDFGLTMATIALAFLATDTTQEHGT